MSSTNYGVLLKKGVTSIGSLVNIELPKISTQSVESTTHASSGLREYIPSGLLEVEEFTATIVATLAAYNTIKTDIDAGTYATYSIDYTVASGLTDWSFSCSPVSISLGSADAASPDLLTMEITFRPSGDVTGF